jgi:hypothetical protein
MMDYRERSEAMRCQKSALEERGGFEEAASEGRKKRKQNFQSVDCSEMSLQLTGGRLNDDVDVVILDCIRKQPRQTLHNQQSFLIVQAEVANGIHQVFIYGDGNLHASEEFGLNT